MAGIPYVGRTPDSDGVVVPKNYADSTQAAAAVTTGAVGTLITATQATLTTRVYADAQDLLVAHKTDVTAADLNYLNASLLNAASGVAGLDSSGNLISAQVPSGTLTDRVAQCFSVRQGLPSPPVFDAVGGVGTIGTAHTFDWPHVGTAGALVLVCIALDRPGPVPGTPTYGGTNLTALTTITNTSGPSGTTYMHWWYLNGIPGGTQTVAFAGDGGSRGDGPFSTGTTWWMGVSISYTNAVSVGTPATAATTGTSVSVTLAPAANQVGVAGMAAAYPSTGATLGSSTGGVQRVDAGGPTLGVSVRLVEATAGASTTITTTDDHSVWWTRMGLLITGQPLPAGVGTTIITGPTTVTSTSTPGTPLATIPVPDLGFPYRVLPFAFVSGDSSGSTAPARVDVGTGSYGLLLCTTAAATSQPLGIGICTGSYRTNVCTLVPDALTNQTPSSVPALSGAQTVNLYGCLWSGTTYTFYPTELIFYVLCVPAL